MIYVILLLFVIVFLGPLVKPIWYSSRINRIEKLGKKHGLSFSTKMTKFLGIYWTRWPIDMDRLEGSISGRNIVITDRLPAALLADRPMSPFTSFKIDGREIKQKPFTAFTVGYLKPISLLDQTLSNLEKGIEPEYK